MLTGLIGMLGLSLDLGFNFVQRRTLQNAADAAVTVALNDISAAAPTGLPNNTDADVRTILAANGFPLATSSASSITCEFLNNSGSYSPAQLCSASQVPLDTSGARVTISETYRTFFMTVLGIHTSTIAATAAGHVELPTLDESQMPFIVCGDNTTLVDGSGATIYQTILANGLPTEVFPPHISAAAYGDQFLIYSPTGGAAGGISRCGLGASDFKGTNANAGGAAQLVNLDPAQWFSGSHGRRTGPTITRVTNGCTGGNLTNCVVIVPIAENAGNPPVNADGSHQGIRCTTTPPSNPLCVDLFVAMVINPLSSHGGFDMEGQLENPQPKIQADGSTSWTVGSSNGTLTTLRLTQ